MRNISCCESNETASKYNMTTNNVDAASLQREMNF